MKGKFFYLIAPLVIFSYAFVLRMAPPTDALFNYQEECNAEGCNSEEIEELYESYAEECLHEGCRKEEIIELGGNPSGALDMLREFQNRGYQVDDTDFMNLACDYLGREEKSYGPVFVCRDSWQCQDGVHQSSWFACGFFFKWSFGW